MHVRRLQKHGDTDARKPGKPYTGRTPEQIRSHIERHVVITDAGCWEWQRSLTVTGGYPALTWRHEQPGHRVAYVAYVGPIPSGLCVLHSCDNPPCCNPAHLFVGTLADNNADMAAKGRANRSGLALGRKQVGAKHGNAKLTPDDVRAIRAADESCDAIAARYGIASSHAWRIRARRVWAHLD